MTRNWISESFDNRAYADFFFGGGVESFFCLWEVSCAFPIPFSKLMQVILMQLRGGNSLLVTPPPRPGSKYTDFCIASHIIITSLINNCIKAYAAIEEKNWRVLKLYCICIILVHVYLYNVHTIQTSRDRDWFNYFIKNSVN